MDLDKKYNQFIKAINYEYKSSETYYKNNQHYSYNYSFYNIVFRDETKIQLYNA